MSLLDLQNSSSFRNGKSGLQHYLQDWEYYFLKSEKGVHHDRHRHFSLRGLTSAPIDRDVACVLDVGTGTGVWAKECQYCLFSSTAPRTLAKTD